MDSVISEQEHAVFESVAVIFAKRRKLCEGGRLTYSADEKRMAIGLLKRGCNYRALSDKLGVSYSTIERWKRELRDFLNEHKPLLLAQTQEETIYKNVECQKQHSTKPNAYCKIYIGQGCCIKLSVSHLTAKIIAELKKGCQPC